MKKPKIFIILDDSIIECHHGVRRYLFSLANSLSASFDVFFYKISVHDHKNYFDLVVFEIDYIFNNGFNDNVKVSINELPKFLATLKRQKQKELKHYINYIHCGEHLPESDICLIGAPWICYKMDITNSLKTYCIGYDAIPLIYTISDHSNIALKHFANEHYLGYKKAVVKYDGILSISDKSSYEIMIFIKSDKVFTIPVFLPVGFEFVRDNYAVKLKTAILAAPFDDRKGVDKLSEIINNSEIEKLIIFGGIRCNVDIVELFFKKIKVNKCEWWSSVTTSKQIELYSSSNVLLFPSYNEGLGLPVLEALACGCNVMVSNIEPLINLADETSIFHESANVNRKLIQNKLDVCNRNENKEYARKRWGYNVVVNFFVSILNK